MTIEDGTGPRRRRRRAVIIAATATPVLVAAVVTAVAVDGAADPGASAAPSGPSPATVTVRRGDLSQSSTFSGTLAYGGTQPLHGAGDGVVTALPAAGAAVRRGTVLYWVNDQPVVVFIGATPLFRTLPALPLPAGNAQPLAGGSGQASAGAASAGSSAPVPEGITGTDVTVVADNLTALGFPPRRGCTVRPRPARGTRWTACLSRALARWQRAVGRPATGALSPGDVVVLPAPARVGAVLARPGDRASGDLLGLTAETKVVSAEVQPQEAGLFRSGEKVTLTRPDGRAVPGTVRSVSRVVTEAAPPGGSGPGNGTPSLTVTVVPDRAADVADLDYAAVEVKVTQLARQGVLTVPVAALLAVKGGGYALQKPDGALVAATVGMVTDDTAEVSGPGLADGMTVVTAS